MSDFHQRLIFYNRWARSNDEAKRLRAPADYNFLLKYPNNFKRVREAFHIAWITHKMTEL